MRRRNRRVTRKASKFLLSEQRIYSFGTDADRELGGSQSTNSKFSKFNSQADHFNSGIKNNSALHQQDSSPSGKMKSFHRSSTIATVGKNAHRAISPNRFSQQPNLPKIQNILMRSSSKDSDGPEGDFSPVA